MKVPRYLASVQNFWIDGYRSYACLAVDIPPFVSWILAAWTTTDNQQPSTSTTMCRFLPFVFSLRQFHVLRWLLPFLHSGNQWSRSLDSPCVQRLFASFSQDAPEFYPKARWFECVDKSCVLWNMVGNHEVIVSIYTRNPPNTALHLSIPTCSTCSCASPYTVVLSLPVAYLPSRSGTTFFYHICSLLVNTGSKNGPPARRLIFCTNLTIGSNWMEFCWLYLTNRIGWEQDFKGEPAAESDSRQ